MISDADTFAQIDCKDSMDFIIGAYRLYKEGFEPTRCKLPLLEPRETYQAAFKRDIQIKRKLTFDEWFDNNYVLCGTPERIPVSLGELRKQLLRLWNELKG